MISDVWSFVPGFTLLDVVTVCGTNWRSTRHVSHCQAHEDIRALVGSQLSLVHSSADPPLLPHGILPTWCTWHPLKSHGVTAGRGSRRGAAGQVAAFLPSCVQTAPAPRGRQPGRRGRTKGARQVNIQDCPCRVHVMRFCLTNWLGSKTQDPPRKAPRARPPQKRSSAQGRSFSAAWLGRARQSPRFATSAVYRWTVWLRA